MSLSPGLHPAKGDILEMSGSSRAVLSFLPNLLAQLDRNARLEIGRLAITKDGNETGAAMRGRYAEARLSGGRLFASQAWGEAIAKFSLRTAQGELVTTANALFCVEANEHKTRVTCVSGFVSFQPTSAQSFARIPPGFFGEWSGSDSTLAGADTDERAQETLVEGLEVEQKLRELGGKNRSVLPR